MTKKWLIASTKKLKEKFTTPSYIIENPTEKRLNIALCGLGRYATLIADGILQSEHCRLTGIITGTPSKARKWKKKFQIPDQNCYNYSNFDEIILNPNIDLIYVLLPNIQHEEFVIRAANAGKHVITEKPMATTPEACLRMLEACKKNNVQLAVGYRLHFEPYHLEIKRLGQEKTLGNIKSIEASIGYDLTLQKKNWKNNNTQDGGGPLFDLGIYCIQACRYVTGNEPLSVNIQSATNESIAWEMEFPGDIITKCFCSFESNTDHFKAITEKGTFELSPAFGYGPFSGGTSLEEFNFPITNQQQVQLDNIANALLHNNELPNHITGDEGLKDITIIHAILKSIDSNEKVILQ